MTNEKKPIATAESPPVEMTVEQPTPTVPALRGTFSLVPRTLTEAINFSELIAASELCPREYRGKPQDVLIAVQMGAELGIAPMQAIQNIAVINGRPTMWGDLALALVRQSGLLESIDERDAQDAESEGEGRCEVQRIGDVSPIVRTFSMVQAETAGLLERAKGQSGGKGTWLTYPGRMLMMRARSWALRDAFPDVLKGLAIREEIDDLPSAVGLSMPRRIGDPEPDQGKTVSEFVARTSGGGGSSARPRRKSDAPQSPTNVETWRGTVDRISRKQGPKEGGGRWTRYTLHATDGNEFYTFEKEIKDAALKAGKEAEFEIRFSKDKYGRKIEELVALEPPEESGESVEGADDAGNE